MINQFRIKELLPLLEVPAKYEKRFVREAKKHGLIHEQIPEQLFIPQDIAFRNRGDQRYTERTYSVYTRDGRTLRLTRVVNLDRVKTNDDNPSVLYVPGIACNGKFFDFDDESSLALDAADHSQWVYLFDPRGMGKNKGDFDFSCFLDSLISNDLTAAADFVAGRPRPAKPVIIIGHSMGGMIAEFMLVRQSYKLAQIIKQLCGLDTRGLSRAEIAQILDNVHSTSDEQCALLAEARNQLALLQGVKGLVTIGSPKTFDKHNNLILPALLFLNILLPLLKQDKVPLDWLKFLVKLSPSFSSIARLLINPDNFKEPNRFLAKMIDGGVDSFPLGVGFQLLKAIYSGQGIKRMDAGKFNYSAHLDYIPIDIPLYHLLSHADPLAPGYNLGFIDEGAFQFPRYRHRLKQIERIADAAAVNRVDLHAGQSRVIGLVIPGVVHLDFFYGHVGIEIVRPLLDRIVKTINQAG